jgi:hypothetical protein
MRKIIFLDIDGVLNTERWHCQTASNELQDEYGYKFDPVAVTNLSKIIEETGADIVISSSWKFMGLSKMRKMWKDRKLPGNVIGITPNTVSDKFLLNVDLDNMDIMAIRGQEVKEWLMLNKNEITNYVILDDMNDILQEQESHFVWIDPEVGITSGNAVQAIFILNHTMHG